MPKQGGLYAYEDRYRMLYEEGVEFWNEHETHPILLDLLKGLDKDSKCIDLGCGEGFEARAIAKEGFEVIGVDLAPIVIKKATESTPKNLKVKFINGDVTDLSTIGIEDKTFDLVTNIGCLHMMEDQEDRNSHLKEIKRILKPGGIFYLQNGLNPNDVTPKNEEEAKIVETLKEIRLNYEPGKKIPKTIKTKDGEKEIMLPLCPNGKFLSLKEYELELESIGFKIVSSNRSGVANMPFEAIIIARV